MAPLRRLLRRATPRERLSRYEAWLEVNRLSERRLAELGGELDRLARPPLIGVVGDVDLGSQLYTHVVPGADAPYVAVVAAGDVLAPDALAEIALAIAADPAVDVVYTDDDELHDGVRSNPRFKPDWSPELLLSTDYIDGLLVMRRELLDLQLADRDLRVVHIPRVLCHRRPRQAAARTCRFADDGPRVAVLVPTRNEIELLDACLGSLQRTTYRNVEIVIVDNESDDPTAVEYLARRSERVLRIETGGRFDFATLMNEAVAAVDAEAVLLLNNDTEVMRGDWLSQMVGCLGRPGVGAVGARLLFPDGRVQHAGVTRGLAHGLAGHAFSGLAADDAGYMSLARVTRNCVAVTGACLLTRRDLFLELGGFDADRFPVSYNDVDYCYRLVDAGCRIVLCAEAELVHHEGRSRGRNVDPTSPAALRARYGGRADPYYNPNLSLEHGRFPIGTRTLPPRRPPRIRTLVCTDSLDAHGAAEAQFELVRRLHAESVIEAVVHAPVEGALAAAYRAEGIEVVANRRGVDCELVYANGVDAPVDATRPLVWSLGDPVPPRRLAAFDGAYQVVFDSDETCNAWKDIAVRRNTLTVPNAIDVDRFRATLVPRAEARSALGLAADATVAICVGTELELDAIQVLRVGGDLLDAGLQYSAADLAVCPEPAATYSRPILEAMAAGLPVVAPRFPEVGHEVSDGVNAVLCDDGDGLTAAVARLAADAGERQRLARNSARVLAALPSFEDRVREYRSLLAEAWVASQRAATT